MKIKLAIVFFVLCFTGLVIAQDGAETCPALVDNVIDSLEEVCIGLGRNQACYGNANITAVARSTALNFTFDQPGDRASVTAIERIALSPLDIEADVWGIAVLQIQANLPNTLPGQNVTMLAFGDVQVEDVSTTFAPVQLIATTTANVRERTGPSTNYATSGTLQEGISITIDGRVENSEWARVRWSATATSWVFAPLLQIQGDINTLPVVRDNEIIGPYLPMQAIVFTSGIGNSACSEAPESGILFQTPQGTGQINFLINGVEVVMGSTVFIQAQAGGELIVRTVEGTATVTAQGATETAATDQQVRVPLTDDLRPTGPPSAPEPIDEAVINALPLGVLPPLGEEIVAVDSVRSSLPLPFGSLPPQNIQTQAPVTVPGAQSWTDTGIFVNAGQTFIITAEGQINPCVNLNCPSFGPEGRAGDIVAVRYAGRTPAPSDYYLPETLHVALVGRIGAGNAPFYVGNQRRFVANVSGTLYLVANDVPHTNNSGEFIAEITVVGETDG